MSTRIVFQGGPQLEVQTDPGQTFNKLTGDSNLKEMVRFDGQAVYVNPASVAFVEATDFDSVYTTEARGITETGR